MNNNDATEAEKAVLSYIRTTAHDILGLNILRAYVDEQTAELRSKLDALVNSCHPWREDDRGLYRCEHCQAVDQNTEKHDPTCVWAIARDAVDK